MVKDVLPLIIILFQRIKADSPGSNQFECGEHGRFEYCLDGFTGCVIGCHCYPGYYFDTHSHICEPNAKLFESSRRYLSNEPPLAVADQYVQSTTAKNSDNDTLNNTNNDDLSDWLYNQFFKTIESQIVNSTDNLMNTRRAGTGAAKPAAKSAKKKIEKIKKKPKRKLNKAARLRREKLKRKLLRLTEDDNIFKDPFEKKAKDDEDDNENDDDDKDDDDDESESDSEDSEDSGSDDSNSDDDRSDRDSHDHGHKKILFIKKSPSNVMPSFLFLPGMNGQYYPPSPMYPMVPVPPVMPQYPYVYEPPCTTTVSTTTEKKKEETPDDGKKDDKKEHKPDDEGKGDEKKDEKHAENNNPDKGNHINLIKPNNKTDSEGSDSSDSKESKKPATKMRMRHPLNKMKSKSRPAPHHDKRIGRPIPFAYNLGHMKVSAPIKQERKGEPQILPEDESLYDKPPIEVDSDPPDFKYLSELIHKDSKNNKLPFRPEFMRERAPIIKNNSPTSSPRFGSHPIVYGRRALSITAPRINNSPDDQYYGEVGQQIASLIRKLNPLLSTQDEEKRDLFNLENISSQGVLNENNPSRSYWERSVRSLLDIPRAKKNKLDNDRLFLLENQAQAAVNSPSVLGLEALENLVNIIGTSKVIEAKTNDSHIHTRLYQRSFNVGLIPKSSKYTKNLTTTILQGSQESNVFVKQHPTLMLPFQLGRQNNIHEQPHSKIRLDEDSFSKQGYYNNKKEDKISIPIPFLPISDSKQNVPKFTMGKVNFKRNNSTNFFFPNQNAGIYRGLFSSNTKKNNHLQTISLDFQTSNFFSPSLKEFNGNKYPGYSTKSPYSAFSAPVTDALVRYKYLPNMQDNNWHLRSDHISPYTSLNRKIDIHYQTENKNPPSFFHHESHNFDYLF